MTRRYKACPTMDSQHCGEHIKLTNDCLYQQDEAKISVFKDGN